MDDFLSLAEGKELMQDFTPLSAAFGGVLIGLSAALFFWLEGRITGISNLVHGLFTKDRIDRSWRAFFLIGMIVGGILSYSLLPSIHFVKRENFPIYLLVLSGILVGIGTRLGKGCTSGHGICGIARLSKRSLMATLIFLIFGVISTYITRQGIHFS